MGGMTLSIKFAALHDALETAGALVDAAEAHGILTGLLCTGEDSDETLMNALGSHPHAPLEAILHAVRTETRATLTSGEFTFEPLLPDEGASMAERSASLTAWCQGLIVGITFGGASPLRALSPEVDEVLHDIEALADADGTVEESDLLEITEYLRVGIQSIYDEAQIGTKNGY